MLIDIKIDKRKIFALIAIYFLVLGIRIYWLSQKEGFHLDEVLSVMLACYNDYMWSRNYDLHVEFTGKEIKEMSLCDNDSIRNVFGDIYHLWRDNRDPPHTNLYYSFLRFSLAGLKTGDIKLIIFRGGILNLLFFTISFIFFFLIMRLLFPDSYLLQITATVCTFLSTATISNTLFLRPYQLQETMFIIFCYLFLKTLNSQKYIVHNLNKDKKEIYINMYLLLSMSLITSITLLSGYYSLLFIGLFGLYIVMIYIKNKHYDILFYFLVFIIGIMAAQFLYLRYWAGFISYRSRETVQTLFGNFSDNVTMSISTSFTLLHTHFFSYGVIAICILCLIYLFLNKQKIKICESGLYIFLASIMYIIIILIIAPYKTLRYVMPVFPFLVILPFIIFNTVMLKNKIFTNIVLIFFCFNFLIASTNKNKIENLYIDIPTQYTFTQNADIPVVVLNSHMWKYADLIPYFNDEQIYYFIEEHNDIYLSGFNEFYYIIETEKEDIFVNDLENNYIITETDNYGYFIWRRIGYTM